MESSPDTAPASVPDNGQALRLARKAWRLLHVDSARAIALAEQALALAEANAEADAAAWARLSRGFHLLYFAAPDDAKGELAAAREQLEALGDRAGVILAGAGLARAMWRSGQFRPALDAVLALRDEGLRVLDGEQRGVLLNTIAGCYSSVGQPDQAFAYMFEALRLSPPAPDRGYDVVLLCNLSDELLQLGDYHEALRCIDDALDRCADLNNPRLVSVLLINRIICLTELGRAREALSDVTRVRVYPTDARGRGAIATHFETMAVAALRAGRAEFAGELINQALAVKRQPIPDEHVELAVAQALLAVEQGDRDGALAYLQRVAHLVGDAEIAIDAADDAAGVADARAAADGLSLRMRCLYFQTLSEIHERAVRPVQALAAMRRWQQLHVERAHRASRARYQAAALQTEILRMQHKLADQDARRRATERARAELEAVNQQLSRRVEQVQALETALRAQAIRDELTGLFNRRHLNAVLPSMLALAQRSGEPLAVAIIDLDDFKAINDRHGHLAGDTLLAAFGRLLARSSRQSDIVCRYGGEEFCLLMPRTDALTAQLKLQAVLLDWRDACFDLNGTTVRGLAFSAGVTDSQVAAESGTADETALLKAADDRLLDAKRSGRNRVLGPAHAWPVPDLPAAVRATGT